MKNPIKICTPLRPKVRGRFQDELLAPVQGGNAMQLYNHDDIYHFHGYLNAFCS